MLDLEESLGRVWNPDVRPLAAEAYRSYATGSARAAIILTWGAVAADIIDKLRRLSEDSEGAASALVEKIEKARAGSDVKLMQEVEASLLDAAHSLELLDSVEKRDLQRLREDRHLCAHPSLRALGEFYVPTLELARTHLVGALNGLLVHPPSQGRRVVERFTKHVADNSFTGNQEYLSHSFFDQVKPAARRHIIDVAAKAACLEPDGLPDPPGTVEIADRMADCLRHFAVCDRDLVALRMGLVVPRLAERPFDVQLRALGRLGDLDVFWNAVPAPLRGQISDLILRGIASTDAAYRTSGLDPTHTQVLSLVGIDEVRDNVPALATVFRRLDGLEQAEVISWRPGPFFAQFLPSLMKKEVSHSFLAAQYVTRSAILPCAPHLTDHQLSELLTTWVENEQCLFSAQMPQLAVELHQKTQHLGSLGTQAWREFITRVHERVTDENSPYRYVKLSTAMGM
ncbi:hypothetical protein ACWLMY_35455 [Streptomyces anulatus]